MSWQEVQHLRKAGESVEAKRLARRLLEEDPGDFRVSSQLQWVIYDEVKQQVSDLADQLKGSPALADDELRKLYRSFREFIVACPQLPSMAASQVLAQVTKIAGHVPRYRELVGWFGAEGLQAEDWEYSTWQDRQMSPLAVKVGRGLARWCKSRPDADPADLEYALDWLARTLPIARGDDALWIQWDRAMLLRRRGDLQEAAASLGAVLKVKRNEFWVWAEAGRVYAKEQPDLALACFCRALTCPAPDGFSINVHAELAALLAESEEFAQASREVEHAVNVRTDKGWSIPKELQQLIESPWYDPDASGAQERVKYYAEHAPAALALCLNEVQTVDGTYLGTIIPKTDNPPPGRKPRPLPRFAVRDEAGQAWSLIGPGTRVKSLQAGDPVVIVKGMQDNGRETIVQVAPRNDGVAWDCIDKRPALVVLGKSDKDGSLHVFLDRKSSHIKAHASALDGLDDPRPGDALLVYVATNPKRGRLDVAWAEPGSFPEHPDVQQFAGHLKRHPKGFAFVESIFVSPPLVAELPPDATRVSGIAICSKKPKREDYGWSAVTLHAAPAEQDSE